MTSSMVAHSIPILLEEDEEEAHVMVEAQEEGTSMVAHRVVEPESLDPESCPPLTSLATHTLVAAEFPDTGLPLTMLAHCPTLFHTEQLAEEAEDISPFGEEVFEDSSMSTLAHMAAAREALEATMAARVLALVASPDTLEVMEAPLDENLEKVEPEVLEIDQTELRAETPETQKVQEEPIETHIEHLETQIEPLEILKEPPKIQKEPPEVPEEYLEDQKKDQEVDVSVSQAR